MQNTKILIKVYDHNLKIWVKNDSILKKKVQRKHKKKIELFLLFFTQYFEEDKHKDWVHNKHFLSIRLISFIRRKVLGYRLRHKFWKKINLLRFIDWIRIIWLRLINWIIIIWLRLKDGVIICLRLIDRSKINSLRVCIRFII